MARADRSGLDDAEKAARRAAREMIPAVSATNGTPSFAADKRLLQREATPDNVNLERGAYVLLAGLAVVWMAVLSWGLLRIERPPSGDRNAPSSPLARSHPIREAPAAVL